MDGLSRTVLSEAYDPIRLWELQAEIPEAERSQLRATVLELLDAELIELVPTNENDAPLSHTDVRAYMNNDSQWLNMVENPWPGRGTIHELIATAAGRAALR